MKILPKFKIDIINGEIIPEDKNTFKTFISSMEAKKETLKHFHGFELTIKPIRGKRTFEHNAFYWSVLIPVLAESMGLISRNETHEQLIMLRYPNGVKKEKKMYDGKIKTWTERKKTSEMNVAEFTDYVEWCKDFGSIEFGINWDEYIEKKDDVYIKKYTEDDK